MVDVPEPTTLLVLAGFAVFWLSPILALGLWVLRDARARGSSQPLVWSLAAILTPIGLPYYLYRRSRGAGLTDRPRPIPKLDRVLATWATTGLLAFLVASVLGPPDPFSQLVYAAGATVVALPVAYLLVYRGGHRRL